MIQNNLSITCFCCRTDSSVVPGAISISCGSSACVSPQIIARDHVTAEIICGACPWMTGESNEVVCVLGGERERESVCVCEREREEDTRQRKNKKIMISIKQQQLTQ